MPCPNFHSDTGECLLQQELEEEDEGAQPVVTDAIKYEWCLSSDKSYRNCPAFRRFVADLTP